MASAKKFKNSVHVVLLAFLTVSIAISGATRAQTASPAVGLESVAPAPAGDQTDEPKSAATVSSQTPQATTPNGSTGSSNSSAGPPTGMRRLYRAWKHMAEGQEGSEPDWLSPLATTSGRIKDELRYDIWRQTTPGGTTVSTFAGGKGLEFIAAPRVQLLLGIPSYIEHSATSSPDGFGDWPLMLKFRIASANVSQGNYLVTFILAATAPTGLRPNGAGVATLAPTMALGKGIGRFDVQTTFGGNLPTTDTQRLGRQLLWNTAFQYRAAWRLWPELEVNSTYFEHGPSAGKTQTFLTPGLGFGRIRLFRNIRFSMAGGLQIAITHFHTYDHRWMLSTRFPF